MQNTEFDQRLWMTPEEIQQINQFAEQLTGKKPTEYPAGMTPCSDFTNPFWYVDYGAVYDCDEPFPAEIEHVKKTKPKYAAALALQKQAEQLGLEETECCISDYIDTSDFIFGFILVNKKLNEKNNPVWIRNHPTDSLELQKIQGNKFVVTKSSNNLSTITFRQVCNSLQEALQIFKQQSADILNTWQ